jgi:hypothetical protein
MNKFIEIATTLHKTGLKRISILYDDVNDIFYVSDDDNIKPLLNNSNLEEMMWSIKKDLDTTKTSLNELKGGVISPIKRDKWPKLTKKENIIRYYYYCMTHNFGQGEGKMVSGFKELPFNFIEREWNKIVEKYNIK